VKKQAEHGIGWSQRDHFRISQDYLPALKATTP
jgi:hypothetical protein